MNLRTIFFLVLAAMTIVRMGIVLGGGVSSENAYFQLCSEHPAPAYFDGPPGTATTVRLASSFGGDWWLLLGPLWAAAASLACWRLGVRIAGEPGGALGAMALNLLPAFNSASLTCGPHPPALTFGLLGLIFVWDASRHQHGGVGACIGWISAAVAFGAASLFSYLMALTGLLGAAAPLLRQNGRTPLTLTGFGAVAGAVALALAGPLTWNAQNAWIPVAGWTLKSLVGLDGSAFLSGLLDLALGLSPLLALSLAWVLWHTIRESAQKSARSFALVACLPSLLATGLSAYRGWDPAMESLFAAAVLLPPACAVLVRSPAFTGAAFLVAGALSIPVFLSSLRANLPESVSHHLLELDARLSPELPGGLFFIAGDPALASSIAYQLRDAVLPPRGHPRVYLKESQDMSSQFSLWPSYDDFIETPTPPNEFFEELSAVNLFLGRSAIYVGREKPDNLPQAITSAFAEVELVQEVEGIHIYLCLDYQTLTL